MRITGGSAVYFAVGAVGVVAATTRAGHVAAQPAAGAPLSGLTAQQLVRFDTGKARFARSFSEPEGLGPIFNKTACSDCHDSPFGGAGTETVLWAGANNKSGFDPLEELGGSLFQMQATSDICEESPPPFANVISQRVTTGTLGYGLIEAIPDGDILANADADDSDADGISGRAHLVEALEDQCTPCEPGELHVGRFGLKAQVATVLTFAAEESVNQLGITNRFRGQDSDPNGDNPPSLAAPDNCDTIPDPEDGVSFGNGIDREFIDVVTDFQRFLAAPPQTPRSGMAGEQRFVAIGCADCHVPAFITGCDEQIEQALRCRTITPYSDFLLHDMGLNGEPIPQGAAGSGEVKTPPLWGLTLRPALWHDGRFNSGAFAERTLGAIAAHDDGLGLSEAAAAAQAFESLPAAEKAAVLSFLGSLGRREFDVNLDHDVTIVDFHFFGGPDAFATCFGSGPVTADDPCALHDVDRDGEVDDADLEVFLSVYAGQRSDCNANDVLDMIDILDETSVDADNDGIPDECQPTCPADSDGDALVGITEFLGVLGMWGTCPPLPAPCPYDLTGDGVVGTEDFLTVIGFWGTCP